MSTENESTVIIDGIIYRVEDLTPQTKFLMNAYRQWTGDIEKERLALAKTEAAVRELAREIGASVKGTPGKPVEATVPPPAANDVPTLES